MKAIIFLLLLLPLFACAQQPDSTKYVWREGWHMGVGVGQLYYSTHWNYIGSDEAGMSGDDVGHSLDKTMLFLSLEKRSVFGKKREKDFRDYYVPMYYTPGYIYFGSFKFYLDFDYGAELMYRVAGKTTADFLDDDDNVISSGGWSAGTGAYFRMSAVAPLPKVNVIWLSVGINPLFAVIHNNAKDVSSSPLVENYRNNPWNESIFMFNGTIGTAGFEFGSFSIVPELRLGLFGTSSSTLKANGSAVTRREPPHLLGWDVKLTKRL